jgi:DNA-binding XRE family transcriptional regulator
MDETLGNYVLMHRKNAGLTQRDLGELVGYGAEGQVPRHEHSRSLPTLLIALSYQVVFDVPVSEIFAGLHECVAASVEGRVAEMEDKLRRHSGSGTRATASARKLQWLEQRRTHSHR